MDRVERTWGAGQGWESPSVPRTLAVFWLASQEVKQKGEPKSLNPNFPLGGDAGSGLFPLSGHQLLGGTSCI